MGLPLFCFILVSVLAAVLAAHLIFFGTLGLIIYQSNYPFVILERVISASVQRVVRESLDSERPELVLPNPPEGSSGSRFLVVSWTLIGAIILVGLVFRCCVNSWIPRSVSWDRITERPRSPAPELAVVARQQLAEVRLRRHHAVRSIGSS